MRKDKVVDLKIGDKLYQYVRDTFEYIVTGIREDKNFEDKILKLYELECQSCTSCYNNKCKILVCKNN